MTIVELRLGIEQAPDPAFRSELEHWLDHGVRVWFGHRIIAVDEDVLTAWRRLMMAGQNARSKWSAPDALIAATGMVHGLGILTRNTADFERAGLTLLDPWSDPTP